MTLASTPVTRNSSGPSWATRAADYGIRRSFRKSLDRKSAILAFGNFYAALSTGSDQAFLGQVGMKHFMGKSGSSFLRVVDRALDARLESFGADNTIPPFLQHHR